MAFYWKRLTLSAVVVSFSCFSFVSCSAKEYKLSVTPQPPVANFSSRSVDYIGGATSVSISTNAQVDQNFPKFKSMLEAALLSNDIQVYSQSVETDTLALKLELNDLTFSAGASTDSDDEFSNRYFYAHNEAKSFSETSAFEFFGIYQKNKDYFTLAIPSDTYFIDASLYNSQKKLLAKSIIKIQSLACLKDAFITNVKISNQENMEALPHWDILKKQNLSTLSLKCLAAHTALSLKEKRPQIFKLED